MSALAESPLGRTARITAMSDTFWTAVSAIGGTLAFFGVVWQAILTRRSLTVSQLMTADAIRSRLDSQAPDGFLSRIFKSPWEYSNSSRLCSFMNRRSCSMC